MHTWFSSCREELEEVWEVKDQLSSTTIDSTRELFTTTQISSGGMSAEYCLATHQFQMLTVSGELDRLQSSTNTTEPATDTGWEFQDMFLGMDLRVSQSCHISLTRAQTSSTVLSRETATPRHSSSEEMVSTRYHGCSRNCRQNTNRATFILIQTYLNEIYIKLHAL